MIRQYTKKTRRKTRLPKLSTTGAVTVTSDPLKDIKLDWGPIELDYVSLRPEVKDRIAKIVRNYVWLDKSEHDAPLLQDALQEIVRLTKSSTELLSALRSSTNEAGEIARQTINQCFDRLHSIPFATVISKYLQACATARNQLTCKSRGSGFVEGGAWRWMVWQLLDVAREYGLPTQVSKPNARLVRQSLFVRFVMAIHNQVVVDVKWPPPSTPAGFATAVYRVRSDWKKQLRKTQLKR
jgi:hypothetical protein